MVKRNDFSTVSPKTVLGGHYSPKLAASSVGPQGAWVGWLDEGQLTWADFYWGHVSFLYDEEGFMVEF